jgi:hypothetical protein
MRANGGISSRCVREVFGVGEANCSFPRHAATTGPTQLLLAGSAAASADDPSIPQSFRTTQFISHIFKNTKIFQGFRFPSLPRKRESSKPLKKLDTRFHGYDDHSFQRKSCISMI